MEENNKNNEETKDETKVENQEQEMEQPKSEEVKDCKEEHASEDKKDRRHRFKKVEKQLEELQEKYNELNDKYLRLFSEFDNYRKRTAKEKLELAKTASESLMLELLPVIDDFERALQTMEKSDCKADYEGVLLICNKLKRTLQQKGLEEIEAVGIDFNTDEHEALTNVPVADEAQKGKVIDVIQKGYKLNGKVIRFARVVVGC